MFRKPQLCVLLLLLIAFQYVAAIPVVVKRQRLGEAQTVTTVSEVTTFSGTMIETCTVTLTPILDDNGQPAFRVVKSCTLASASGNNSSATPSPEPSLAVDPNPPSDTPVSDAVPSASAPVAERPAPSNPAQPASSAAPPPSPSTSPTATASPTQASGAPSRDTASPSASPNEQPSTSDSAPAGAATSSRVGPEVVPVPRIPVASVSGSASASPSAPSASAQPSQGSGAASASPVANTPAPSPPANNPAAASTVLDANTSTAVASEGGPSGTAAEAEGPPTQAAAMVIPGQHVEVLPIGLGVFAGISVIALIIVGLVTYERTKYRKKFRDQKLAESGAAMGYGGMAQRA